MTPLPRPSACWPRRTEADPPPAPAATRRGTVPVPTTEPSGSPGSFPGPITTSGVPSSIAPGATVASGATVPPASGETGATTGPSAPRSDFTPSTVSRRISSALARRAATAPDATPSVQIGFVELWESIMIAPCYDDRSPEWSLIAPRPEPDTAARTDAP